MHDNSIAVIAIDKETGKRVGEYPSIAKAARSLYIRRPDSIHVQIFGSKTQTFTKSPGGITSYKTGKKYLFERKID